MSNYWKEFPNQLNNLKVMYSLCLPIEITKKIIDAVAKVDKAFGNDTPSSAHLDLDMYGPTPSGPRFFSHSPRHSGFCPSSFGYQRPYPYYFPRYNRRGGDLSVVHAIIAGVLTIVLIIVSKRILIERQIWVKIRKILEQVIV